MCIARPGLPVRYRPPASGVGLDRSNGSRPKGFARRVGVSMPATFADAATKRTAGVKAVIHDREQTPMLGSLGSISKQHLGLWMSGH